VTYRPIIEQPLTSVQERTSGSRLRAAPRFSYSPKTYPTLLIVGDEIMRPWAVQFDTPQVDVRWIRELNDIHTVLSANRFDVALVHASVFSELVNLNNNDMLNLEVYQFVVVGESQHLSRALKGVRTPLVLSNQLSVEQHYEAINNLLQTVHRATTNETNRPLISAYPASQEPSYAILAHLTKELANLSMVCEPAVTALEELTQKEAWAIGPIATLSNSLNRIGDCLRDVATILGPQIDKKTTLTIRALERFVDDHIEQNVPNQRFLSRLSQSLWPVQVNECNLRTICKLLLSNARNATTRGGEVLLEADNVTLRCSHPDNPDILPGDYVRMRVCDSGFGMSQSTITRAKSPFFTTWSENTNWSGLGLTQAEAICRRSGGGLTVFSEEGRGTIVTAWLPRIKKSDNKADSNPTFEVAPASKFLLVDDEPAVLRTLASGLERLGHVVCQAQDKVTAVTILEDEPNFNFAVIDLNVERDSGLELAQLIANKHQQIRIVVCSGIVDFETSHKLSLSNDGAIKYLRKPFSACDLISALNFDSHADCES
jgi:ActR/RegA family two-component response regulator/signal transduction histidine kinase